MGTSKFAGKQGSICGQIWIPYRDQFAPLRAEIPLLETVGGCPSPVLSKDLNNPSQSPKYAIEQKKRPLRVKPSSGQKKNNRTVFQVYIVVYLPENKHHSIRCSAACLF